MVDFFNKSKPGIHRIQGVPNPFSGKPFVYNPSMPTFNYYYPITVRYADLDPQWHVNNARILTFIEQTRLTYFVNLGIFDGEHFFDLGLIVADIHIAYLAPIKFTEKIRVGMKIVRLGNKSFSIDYLIENEETGEAKARAEVVMVTFDYHQNKSVPISAAFREKVAAFEGIESGPVS
jgi:acyl-CoA thioester hydrolase